MGFGPENLNPPGSEGHRIFAQLKNLMVTLDQALLNSMGRITQDHWGQVQSVSDEVAELLAQLESKEVSPETAASRLGELERRAQEALDSLS
ncbi:MAG: hypothetical protein HY397_04080 [Candidatus Doudnabacteria bacterium]|nr:hypothetical protein [Candidatus Doudnabacteria bacterium]